MSALSPPDHPLTFFFCGGEIIWRGDGRPVPISADHVKRLLDLFQTEHDKALHEPADRVLARKVRTLFLELTDAQRELQAWKRLFRAPDEVLGFELPRASVVSIVDRLAARTKAQAVAS